MRGGVVEHHSIESFSAEDFSEMTASVFPSPMLGPRIWLLPRFYGSVMGWVVALLTSALLTSASALANGVFYCLVFGFCRRRNSQ